MLSPLHGKKPILITFKTFGAATDQGQISRESMWIHGLFYHAMFDFDLCLLSPMWGKKRKFDQILMFGALVRTPLTYQRQIWQPEWT